MSTDQRNPERHLRRLAATQSGYFSAAQARDVGYSYQSQTYHTQKGNWERVARGIFRLPEWPVGDHDDLVRWTLWSRGPAVVSHDTAISVHDLADLNPRRVHLTVPLGFRAKATDVVLHYDDLPKGDVWDREGYRITTPFRTALDAAASELSLEQLTEVVKRVCELAPYTAGQGLRQEAERKGHREALRMERALQGAAVP